MKKILLVSALFIIAIGYGQEHYNTIQDHLKSHITELDIKTQDIQELRIASQSYSKSMQLFNIYVTQQYNAIDIYNAIGVFAIKNNKVVHSALSFKTEIAQKVNTTHSSITQLQAIENAIVYLNIENAGTTTFVKEREDGVAIFLNTTVSSSNILVKTIYQPVSETEIRLAWDITLDLKNGEHLYSMRVDAITGKVIDMADWVVSCAWDQNPHNHTEHATNKSVLFENVTNAVTNINAPVIDGSSYNVYNFPLKSPDDGTPTLVENPADDAGSPFGWHDINGVEGAEFTITRGNNVWAYEDLDGDNDTEGISPDGGSSLDFNFDYDLTQEPVNYLDAATTNLFYWNNLIHDITYLYGFDEASGNFQANNYNNGGIANDAVEAQAQDGTRLNNANFRTPPDGDDFGAPRMQMYLWSAPEAVLSPVLFINDFPNPVITYLGFDSDYGGTQLPVSGPIIGALVVLEDTNADTGSTDPHDGCDAIVNASEINGKIVLIRNGFCDPIPKIIAAEAAGALGVVMVNNVVTDPREIRGDGGTAIGIPAITIYQEDGEDLIERVLEGEEITVSLKGTTIETADQQRDGDIDNEIIAHEYGHGVSIRLTGGGNNVSCLISCTEVDEEGNCLNFTEQMGEGWSDWLGLILTMKATDTPEDIRGLATYSLGQTETGRGIRTKPYTTDTSINDFTYADTNDGDALRAPHGVGSVWATVLWDLTWALIDEYGFDEDFYRGTGGNNIAMQLIMDGMKLQQCNPGFVSGRNAILMADELANAGANRCIIWEVFAARGIGASAMEGSALDRFDQVENFDMPAGPDCTLSTTDVSLNENNIALFPNPAKNTFTIQTAYSLGEVTISIANLNGNIVKTTNALLDNRAVITINTLPAGIYIVSIQGAKKTVSKKLIVF